MPLKSYKVISVKMLPNSPILVMAVLLVSSVSGSWQESCKMECSSAWVDDCEVCHTVHYRECTITMKTVMVPRKIRRCSPRRLSVLDGIECKDGARMRCKVRFETECSNTMEYKTIEEDYPECKREKVEKCSEQERQDMEFSNFVIPRPRQRCSTVEVMRCKIVKRTRRKARPRHQCKRVPRKACVKYPCDEEAEDQCRVSVKLEREERPEEECSLSPRRVCHQGECRPRLRRTCRCTGAGDNTEEARVRP